MENIKYNYNIFVSDKSIESENLLKQNSTNLNESNEHNKINNDEQENNNNTFVNVDVLNNSYDEGDYNIQDLDFKYDDVNISKIPDKKQLDSKSNKLAHTVNNIEDKINKDDSFEYLDLKDTNDDDNLDVNDVKE